MQNSLPPHLRQGRAQSPPACADHPADYAFPQRQFKRRDRFAGAPPQKEEPLSLESDLPGQSQPAESGRRGFLAMEKIREITVQCVGRAVMFGTLAIFCVMLGLSFDPAAAFRAGAFMVLAMSGVLLFKAMNAFRTNPKRTEVWLYLDEKSRPSEADAKFVFAIVLRDVYGRFARASLGVAVVLFGVSLALTLAGVEGTMASPG